MLRTAGKCATLSSGSRFSTPPNSGEEYGRTLDIPGLAAAVDSQEHAAGVYADSVMMVNPPSLPEQIYLDTLARELGLEAGLAGEVHATPQANRAWTRRWRAWMNMRPDDMAHMTVLDKFKQQIIMLARVKALLDKSAMADR